MNFTLIVPAFNEFESLKILLPKIQHLTNDIIVIDPGTKDGTEELCSQYSVRWIKQNSRGKGKALAEAVNEAQYETVCFIDADLAHDPSSVIKLVTPILHGDAVHVSGSRMLGGSSELFADADHFFRLLGSLIINYAISLKFGWKMTDCQNGFRAIDKNFFKSLNLNSVHTTIEQELVGKTLASGNFILEVPAHEYARIAGESKISVVKHGFNYILVLGAIMLSSKLPIDTKQGKKVKEKYSYNWWLNN